MTEQELLFPSKLQHQQHQKPTKKIKKKTTSVDPFKSLCQLKTVQKDWNRLIFGDDHLFKKPQCRLTPVNCFVSQHSTNGGLMFLDPLGKDDCLVGVPDPSLFFIGDDADVLNILASTNGLLFLYCHHNYETRF